MGVVTPSSRYVTCKHPETFHSNEYEHGRSYRRCSYRDAWWNRVLPFLCCGCHDFAARGDYLRRSQLSCRAVTDARRRRIA